MLLSFSELIGSVQHRGRMERYDLCAPLFLSVPSWKEATLAGDKNPVPWMEMTLPPDLWLYLLSKNVEIAISVSSVPLVYEPVTFSSTESSLNLNWNKK